MGENLYGKTMHPAFAIGSPSSSANWREKGTEHVFKGAFYMHAQRKRILKFPMCLILGGLLCAMSAPGGGFNIKNFQQFWVRNGNAKPGEDLKIIAGFTANLNHASSQGSLDIINNVLNPSFCSNLIAFFFLIYPRGYRKANSRRNRETFMRQNAKRGRKQGSF